MDLKRKIILILLVSSITPVLIIGLIGTTKAQHALAQQVGVDSLELARLTLERISEYLHLEFEDVRSWPHLISPENTTDEGHYGRLSESLTHVQKVHDEYYNIVMSDKEGKIVASSDTKLIGSNLSQETGFQEAIAGKPNIQDVAFNAAAGGWAIVFSVPVMESHESLQVKGVLSAVLKWDTINAMITDLQFAGRRQRESDHFMLFNSEGTVISCFDPAELFTENLIEVGMDSAKLASEKKEGFFFEKETEHGLESYSSFTYLKKYKDLPDFGWGLVLLQDPDRVFASVNLLKNTTKFTVAVFVLILSVVSLVFAHRITKPILAIAAAAVNLGKGQLSTRVNINSKDELGTLASSFNTMASELEQSDTRLRGVIEKRMQAEESLEVSNYDLNKTVGKLEEANKELKDFVYIASHDLREPLRKISSFGSLLEDSLTGKLSNDEEENLQFMIDGAERMTQMIEGLLLYSRTTRQEVPFERVDLNEIVDQLQQLELAELLDETNGVIEVPQSLPTVMANPSSIRQVLQNLITNSIIYRKDDETPRIIITAKQTDDNKIRIDVQDNGIGIKQDYYGEVFKMFKRLHSRQKYRGTGIGLAVCKKIVERHNGQIGVESELGTGTTFYFTLSPAEEPAAVLQQA
ncbi:MAG: HAMP domain-containing protein [Planctomycetes bacterium]|nr:HAMP domain-containing protein [Planctomycetota bacterium]